METVYIETTIFSYLVSRPSRDLLVAAHQETTQEWWLDRRQGFKCYISQVVIDEISVGDPNLAEKRMEIVRDLPVLEVTGAAQHLAEAILSIGAIPPHAVREAAHVAVAAEGGMDYLLTWNCKHLANAQLRRRLSMVCNREGYDMPLICTPEELMEG
jgi:hypothetical protein